MTVSTTATLAAAVLLATAPLTDDAVRAEVDRLVREVAAVRRLPFRGALPVRVAPREAMRADVAAALSANVASSNIAAEEQILKRLGLIPATADYTKLLADATFSAPVPFYDPGTKRLLVPAGLTAPLDAQRYPLAHEIAHALTDRRFDVDRFVKLDRGNRPLDGDTQRARMALVEGDATVAALELGDRRGGFLGPHAGAALADRFRAAIVASEGRVGAPTSPSKPPAMGSDGRSPSAPNAIPSQGTPPWLVELARFSHVDGFTFVSRIRAERPWSAVDAVWLDPPASSEQILHPEKYDACEEPVRVDAELLPALPGFERPKASTVLGELVARAWLATSLPADIAARAAAGWGGDRAAVYDVAAGARPDAGAPANSQGTPEGFPNPPALDAMPPLAWLTVWDDAGEADDFARAAEQAAAAAANPPAVSRRAAVVALFFGPRELASAATDGMLDGWRASLNAQKKGARPRRGARPGCQRRDRTPAPP